MNIWTFRVYKEAWEPPEKEGAFERWRASLCKKDKARLQALFEILYALPEWRGTSYIKYRRHYQHWELRKNGLYYPLRPLGFFSGAREFTLLLGAHEEENKLVPNGADKIADDARKLVEEDKERYSKPYEA